MTDERRLDCPICDLPLANALRRYLDGIPAHASCVRALVRPVEGQKRLIYAGETYASQRRSAYRRGKSPGSYR